MLDGIIPGARLDTRAAPDVEALARWAATGPAPAGTPRPLYLRAPDARTIEERRMGQA